MSTDLAKDKSSIAREFFAFAAGLATVSIATFAAAAEFSAGAFSFSDELGGFRLLSATGTGTTDDPIVIVEEIPGVDLVTIVIRRRNVDPKTVRPVQDRLTLVKEVINRSNRVWAGYDVELREIPAKPSTRRDGLSFNQAGAQPGDIQSDAFALIDRRFEPQDRVSFQGGFVDPGARVRFRLTITDPTPVPEFYLLQDPDLLSAGLPDVGRGFANASPTSFRRDLACCTDAGATTRQAASQAPQAR